MPAGIFDSSSGSIWNHDNGYNNPSATELANQNNFAQNILDPTGLVSGLWNDLTGVTSQSREFSQQEYLQDKQNEYNLPANQMARMKAAGINPNLAASAIAQGGNESAQAPAVSSNTGGASAGLGAIGSAVGGVAGAALTAAQKRNLDANSAEMLANANRTNTLLDYEVGKFQADTAKTWIDAGMDSHLADYWSTKAAYADRQEWLDVQGKFWSISKVQQEITNLEDEHNLKVEDLKIRKLQVTEEQYKMEMLAIDKWFAEERKRIYQAVGIDVDQTEDGMLIEAYANGQSEFILDAYKGRSHAITQGNLDATREQLREQLRIEYEERLKNRAQELLQDEQFRKQMAKLGIASDQIQNIMNVCLKYMFAQGIGISVGRQGVSVTNSAVPPK